MKTYLKRTMVECDGVQLLNAPFAKAGVLNVFAVPLPLRDEQRWMVSFAISAVTKQWVGRAVTYSLS
jgi:hypothetical protein